MTPNFVCLIINIYACTLTKLCRYCNLWLCLREIIKLSWLCLTSLIVIRWNLWNSAFTHAFTPFQGHRSVKHLFLGFEYGRFYSITTVTSHCPLNFDEKTPDVTFLLVFCCCKFWYPYLTNKTETGTAQVFSLIFMACKTSNLVGH